MWQKVPDLQSYSQHELRTSPGGKGVKAVTIFTPFGSDCKRQKSIKYLTVVELLFSGKA